MSESELERSRRVNARPSTKKPLSEVEIVNMFYSPKYRYDEDGDLNFIAFARAIEERHGIK